MGKNLLKHMLSICVAAFFVMVSVLQALAANDLYYFKDVGSFDLHSLKEVSSLDSGADIRYGTTGSKWYFIGLNGASIKDLGAVDFNTVKLPDTGYSIDRTFAAAGHVYAVKCGDGSHRAIKVNAYDPNSGSTEFMVKTAEPARKLKLYYLNGDYLNFDFETMNNNSVPRDMRDIYYKYSKNVFVMENGSVIQDLGLSDYDSVKAPAAGYIASEFTAITGHTYAIKTGSNNTYVIKITNVISESEVEFMARKAEAAIDANTPGQGQTGEANANIIDLTAAPIKGTVYLDWMIKNPGDINGYYIYRANIPGGYTVPLTDFPILKREFEDSTAKEGVPYYYIVKAVLPENKQSEPSNEVKVTIKKESENESPVTVKTVIVLKVGNPMMTVNGISKEIDPGNGTSPVILGTRTFLPIRSVIDELKGTVGWDGNESKVTVTLNDKKVELWIGKNIIKVNGKEEEMDVVPQIVNGRTMLPVRFVTSNLNCNLEWDGFDQKITITYPGSSDTAAAGGDTAAPAANTTIEKSGSPNSESESGSDGKGSSELESVIKGEIKGGKYIYNGNVIFEIDGTLDWACISPDENYAAYRDGQYINYYDISSGKHIELYRLTTDEYMGKYVYNYGFTSPTNYDFVKWSDDSTYFIVDRWTKDIFKGGSGFKKINISDKTMTSLNE